jgi:hypothetical protein
VLGRSIWVGTGAGTALAAAEAALECLSSGGLQASKLNISEPSKPARSQGADTGLKIVLTVELIGAVKIVTFEPHKVFIDIALAPIHSLEKLIVKNESPKAARVCLVGLIKIIGAVVCVIGMQLILIISAITLLLCCHLKQ